MASPAISKRILALVMALTIFGCVPDTTSAPDVSPSASVGNVPAATEGAECKERALVVDSLVCVNGRQGLRWQEIYTYQDVACDPDDPRLTAAKVVLPSSGEARIAAACVALEWIANKDATLPPLQVISSHKLSDGALESLQSSARSALRLFWKYRGVEDIDPTMVIATSNAEHCKIITDNQVAGEAERQKAFLDCGDAKPYPCEFGYPGAFAVQWNPINSLDQRSAGYKQSACRKETFSGGLSHHKFWQGIGSALTLNPEESTAFSLALVNPDYLFAEHTAILHEADMAGSTANLCGPSAEHYTCQARFRGSLSSYTSSSQWWQGQEPEDELSVYSQPYNYARQAALEWFTAHFGLDAGYGLLQAMVGVANETEYLLVLGSYTNKSAIEIFAGIDGYVAPIFGLQAP